VKDKSLKNAFHTARSLGGGLGLVFGAGALAEPAVAASMEVKIDVPRMTAAEYHKPYVAIWIEGADRPARTLNLWYDAKNREDAGTKWLADLRQWWRKAGRTLALPTDGVTGATRAPGPQTVVFTDKHPALAGLPAGQYQIAVEAARELGGQEVVRTAIQWPPKTAQTLSSKGAAELGAVTVSLKP
jgi:hypothetical protein